VKHIIATDKKYAPLKRTQEYQLYVATSIWNALDEFPQFDKHDPIKLTLTFHKEGHERGDLKNLIAAVEDGIQHSCRIPDDGQITTHGESSIYFSTGGTAETAFLSRRMVYRVARKVERQKRTTVQNRRKLPIREVVIVGFGQYSMQRPDFYPTREEQRTYSADDDKWDDWTEAERDVLKKRLEKGANPKALFTVFKVKDEMAAALRLEVFGEDVAVPLSEDVPLEEEEPRIKSYVPEVRAEPEVIPVESHESEEYDTGRFNPLDFPSTDDRRYANRRWVEHERRIDLDKPVNQTQVEMLILLEVRFRKVRRDCGSEVAKTRKDAFAELKEIRADYSKAAGDVAQLEKQNKQAPDQESLDAVIERTHDIRPGWRDIQIENEMAIRGLYDLYEQFHRTHLDVEETEPVKQELPEPKPKPASDAVHKLALRRLEQSEIESGIIMGSDG
jgi:Holliday junction resolvase RusA-like endonuclease